MVDAELSAKLGALIRNSHELQQHSQECRQRAEELTVQAEHLFTERELIEERGIVPNANNQGVNDNGKPSRKQTRPNKSDQR
jgi:hypothetical protein